MTRVPGHYLRDTIEVRSYIGTGPTRRSFGDPRTVKCLWEGRYRLRSEEMRRRYVSAARVIVPFTEMMERDYQLTRQVTVVPRRVGERTGSLKLPPTGVAATKPVSWRRQRPSAAFSLEDRITYKGQDFQILEFKEWDGPRGPDHYDLVVVDQRE